MEITTEYLTEIFREYNKLYFNGELPLPQFRLLKSYRTLGFFSCKKIIGRRRLKGTTIEISCRFDWDESVLRDVMVHEMIHYYLAFKHIDNQITHGEAFMQMSEDFNKRFGLNITVEVDNSKSKPSSSASRLAFLFAKYIW